MTNDTKAQRTIIYAGDPRAPAEVWLEWSALSDGSEMALEDDFTEKPDFTFMPVRYVSEAAQAALIEKAAETCWHGLHVPEDPMDPYGWMKSDTPERHASMVLEWNLWKTSEAIRALSPDATVALAARDERIRREAVEQERERCAQIAEDFGEPGMWRHMSDDYRKGWEDIQSVIAAAIREADDE